MKIETKVCGKAVGSRPYWMGVGQYDQCYCILDKDHAGKCKCSHGVEVQ